VTEDGSIVNDLTVASTTSSSHAAGARHVRDSQFEHAVQLRELGCRSRTSTSSSRRVCATRRDRPGTGSESTSPEAQEQKQLALEAQRGEVRKVHAEATQKEPTPQEDQRAGIANDQNAEFVAKMKELEQEYALRAATRAGDGA